MALKLGLVTGEYPPMQGGVGAFTQELAQALAAMGHDVHIITSTKARPTPQERHWRELREPVDLDFGQLYPLIRHWRWPSLAQVVDIVLRHDLDLVNIQYQAAAFHMRSPAINFLPWRLKGITKTAVTFHDLRTPYLFPKAGRLRQTAVYTMARQAHGAIVTNAQDYQSLTARIQSPVCQIPIGSNITVHTPTTAEKTAVRQQLNVPSEACLLGYFGFLNESKGADTLLHALAKLDEQCHLVFIGGRAGTSDAHNNRAFDRYLDSLIANLNLSERVHWTGFVADNEVSTYLHTADLMVMPYRDGVSLRRGTLMAVLAHGRPLITTTPSTPTPELVHGQNAWFVSVDDATALTEAIRNLTADSRLRTKLGQGAAQVADLFTWDKIAMKTAEFFETLMKR